MKSFSQEKFAGAMRAGDSRRYKINIKDERDTLIEAGMAAAEVGPVGFEPLATTSIKKKKCFSVLGYSQVLILRILAKLVRQRYQIRVKGRDAIVKDVIAALTESASMYVIRRDIKNFYETLPVGEVRDNVLLNAYISSKKRDFIRNYFDVFSPTTIGVPRGIGLSAVISELVLQESDLTIKASPGVYRYFRFADDILIFSTVPPEELEPTLQASLPVGVVFNKRKGKRDDLAIVGQKGSEREQSFEYLGYRFTFNDRCGDRKAREVKVGIADRKLKRIKTRVICAFKSYEITKDFDLLLDRIKFASSNYVVFRHGSKNAELSRNVNSGIYYNYSLCGTYQGRVIKPYQCEELKALDAFYHSLLRGAGSAFTKYFNGPANHSKMVKLSEISFHKGYADKMMVRFTNPRIKQIKKVWKNV